MSPKAIIFSAFALAGCITIHIEELPASESGSIIVTSSEVFSNQATSETPNQTHQTSTSTSSESTTSPDITTESSSSSSSSSPSTFESDDTSTSSESALCGNNILENGEECDYDNFPQVDGACGIDCRKRGQLAFITSLKFSNGEISFDWQSVEGLVNVTDDQTQVGFTENRIDDADMFCWQLARNAFQKFPDSQLKWAFHPPTDTSRPFRAWLSDDDRFPLSTFTSCPEVRPYIRTDGTLIAESFDDLVLNGPAHSINRDEHLQPLVSDEYVWTGTTASGKPVVSNTDCHNWNGPVSEVDGILSLVGVAYAFDPAPELLIKGWTAQNNTECLSKSYRIYCFEQCPE